MKFESIVRKKSLNGYWYSPDNDICFKRWERYSDPNDLPGINDLEERI